MLSFKGESQLTIKPVGAFDLGRLARLHKHCFEEGWSRADLAHLLALPGGFGLIARQSSGGFGFDALRGVGFALLRVVRDECELLSLGVIPAQRRRGIAAAILQQSMQNCHDAGARTMFLEVAIDNLSAQALYERFQFSRVGTRPDYYARPDGSRMHAYTMRADLVTALASAGAAGACLKSS
jgi:[ribosomal protein S18]-alanine N-acetyltransferase